VVCLADAALNRRMCSIDEIEAGLRHPPSRHGLPRARLSARHFTELSESVAESRSRLSMHDAGLPKPSVQKVIRCPSGSVFRPDFLWEEEQVIGECHGMRKSLDSGDSAESRRRLRLEKARENELQAMGFVVVRWGWDDLSTPATFITRLDAVLSAR